MFGWCANIATCLNRLQLALLLTPLSDTLAIYPKLTGGGLFTITLLVECYGVDLKVNAIRVQLSLLVLVSGSIWWIVSSTFTHVEITEKLNALDNLLTVVYMFYTHIDCNPLWVASIEKSKIYFNGSITMSRFQLRVNIICVISWNKLYIRGWSRHGWFHSALFVHHHQHLGWCVCSMLLSFPPNMTPWSSSTIQYGGYIIATAHYW